MTKKPHAQVLIKDAVKAFDYMQKHIASRENFTDDIYPYPQPCVYLQMHWLEMRVAGWKDADFDTLAAVSGASALFGYVPRDFMPKYANLFIGMDRRIAEATGFGYEWVKFRDAQHAWQIIKESLDSGRPVKGWDWENILFAGYREAGKAEDRRIFAIADGPGTYAKWLTWKEFTEWLDRITKWKQTMLGRHSRRVRKVAAKKIALRVMRDLVTWSKTPPAACCKRFPKATFGMAGMAAYARDCADVGKYKSWGMCHEINSQWTVRHSTAIYLGRLAEAKTFPKTVREHIATAAEGYRTAYDAWHKTYGLLGHGATKRQRQGKKRREAGADLVLQAREHEKAAIAEIEKALAVLLK